jgi:hypothetical protein
MHAPINPGHSIPASKRVAKCANSDFQYLRTMPKLEHKFAWHFRPVLTILDASLDEHRHMNVRSAADRTLIVEFGQREKNAFLRVNKHGLAILTNEPTAH